MAEGSAAGSSSASAGGAPVGCKEGNGKGMMVRLRQIGPGMVQQIQMQCPQCSGSGYSVKKQKERQVLEVNIEKIAENFMNSIDEAYFDEASTIGHIDASLFGYFTQLRKCGIKVALNTGYPQDIQLGLIKKLEFEKVIDDYISSYEVPEGRPYPYMINRLVERLGISSNRRVAKVGDSVRDIEEGRNAGCGLVVGVLTGADTAEALLDAGADLVAGCVTDLPVPRQRAHAARLRLPDLS